MILSIVANTRMKVLYNWIDLSSVIQYPEGGASDLMSVTSYETSTYSTCTAISARSETSVLSVATTATATSMASTLSNHSDSHKSGNISME